MFLDQSEGCIQDETWEDGEYWIEDEINNGNNMEFEEFVCYEDALRPIDGQRKFMGVMGTRGSMYAWQTGLKLNLNWVITRLNGKKENRRK